LKFKLTMIKTYTQIVYWHIKSNYFHTSLRRGHGNCC